MKKFQILFAIALFTAATTVKAQDRPQLTEEQKQELAAQFQQNKERLALNPEQETPFKDISKKYAQEMKTVKESSDDRRDKFKKFKDIRDRKNIEMKGLLSESQYKIYLQIQEERIEKMKERRKQ
jgi:hypothetical protein